MWKLLRWVVFVVLATSIIWYWRDWGSMDRVRIITVLLGLTLGLVVGLGGYLERLNSVDGKKSQDPSNKTGWRLKILILLVLPAAISIGAFFIFLLFHPSPANAFEEGRPATILGIWLVLMTILEIFLIRRFKERVDYGRYFYSRYLGPQSEKPPNIFLAIFAIRWALWSMLIAFLIIAVIAIIAAKSILNS